MVKNLLLLLGIIFSSTIIAELPPPIISSQISTNNEGLAEGLFHIRYDQQLGTKTDQEDEKSDAEYEDLAKDFIMQYQDMFHITSPSELQLKRMSSDAFGNKHLHFFCHYRGITIKDMAIVLHFNNQAQITAMNGYVVPLSLPLKSTINAQLDTGTTTLKIQQVLTVVAGDNNINIDQLKLHQARVLIIKNPPYIIWQLSVAIPGNIGYYQYHISDEAVPNILKKEQQLRF